MATFVKAPQTASASQLGISFNTDVFFHTSSGSVQSQLSTITMSGVEDYELTWFGLAIGGNTSTITSTQFQTNIDNTGMTEAFSGSAQGVDWDLLISKTQTKNNVPTTDSRLGAIVETDYFTFSSVTATTLSEAYKEIWTGGKLANDSSDPNYNDYVKTSALNFATSTMGTEGHIFNDDVANVLFVAFWGPGRYVKEVAKRFKIRPTSNQTTEFVLQACLRTETQDTVFSETAKLRESTTGLPAVGTTFFYNQGQDTEWITDDLKDDNTDMIDPVVYPHTSLVQLSYPRAVKLEDKDDDTTFGFIYEGKKIGALTQSTATIPSSITVGSDAFSNNTADVAHDFISNKRFGLGLGFPTLTSSASVVYDPQTNYLRKMLFEAKTRANETMTITDSSGSTSTQNRYTFNSVLDQESNKLETLEKILNNMHSQYYFHNGFLKICQDRPNQPIKVVNQSAVREFKVVGRNKLPQFNTVYTKFNNERKMFKQDTAFAELRDQQNTGMPVVSKEIVMQGITNKHQAERHSTYTVETQRTVNEYVEYQAGADHAYVKPGDLIYLTHTDDDGEKYSGRIQSVNGNYITLDGDLNARTFTFNGNEPLDIYIDNGVDDANEFNPYGQSIANDLVFHSSGHRVASNRILLDSVSGLKDINDSNTIVPHKGQLVNIVERPSATLGEPDQSFHQTKIYRVVSITELDTLQYQVVAERHNRNRAVPLYDASETLEASNKFERIDSNSRVPSFELDLPSVIDDQTRIQEQTTPASGDPAFYSKTLTPRIKNWTQSQAYIQGSIKINITSTTDTYAPFGGSSGAQGTATVAEAEVLSTGLLPGYSSSSLSSNDFTINFSSADATETGGIVDLQKICDNAILRFTQSGDSTYDFDATHSGGGETYALNQDAREVKVTVTSNIQHGPSSGSLTWANASVSDIVKVSTAQKTLYTTNLSSYVSLRQGGASPGLPSGAKSDGMALDLTGAFTQAGGTWQANISLTQPNYDTGLLGPKHGSSTELERIWPSITKIEPFGSDTITVLQQTGATISGANTTKTNRIQIDCTSTFSTNKGLYLSIGKGNNNTVVVSDPQLCPSTTPARATWPHHHSHLTAGQLFDQNQDFTYVSINGVVVKLSTFNGTTYKIGDTMGSGSGDLEADAADIAVDINAASIPNITASTMDGPYRTSGRGAEKLLVIQNTAGGPIVFDVDRFTGDGNFPIIDDQGFRVVTPESNAAGTTAYTKGSGTTSVSSFGMRQVPLQTKASEHITAIHFDFS
jgi:hypothetical protein